MSEHWLGLAMTTFRAVDDAVISCVQSDHSEKYIYTLSMCGTFRVSYNLAQELVTANRFSKA
jgi:hypothetical protein